MATEYPLSLIIKAVDKATAPLRAINKRMQEITAPVRKLNSSVRALADEAGVPRLTKGFAGVGKAVASIGKQAVALGLKLAASGTAAAYGFYRMMRGSVDAGDKLSEMAQRVGLSVDAYAQLQFAAAQADVEQEAFNGAMDQFNKRLGEAKAGGGPLLEFLQKVAPTFAYQVAHAKNTEQALALVTRAFERVTDPAKRAALAEALFGRSGLQMGQFLGQGSKRIEETRRRYLELAGSQQVFADRMSEADNALREADTAFGGLRNAIFAGLAPGIVALSKGVGDFLAKNRDGLGRWAEETGQKIKAWVEGGGINRVVDTMERWGTSIERVVDKLGGLKGMSMIVAGVLSVSLLGAIVSFVGTLGTLSTALLATPLGWFLAAVGALAVAALLVIKYWEPIKKFFVDLWATVTKAFSTAWEKIKPVVDTVSRFVSRGPVGMAVDLGESIGAALAAPGGAPAGRAQVSVDFNNLPRGARVTEGPDSTADLDLSMGYSLVGP